MESVKGKSKRECEKIFEEVAPETAKKIQIEVSPELFEKLKRIHALAAHKNKSVPEVLEWMADKVLNKIESNERASKEVESSDHRSKKASLFSSGASPEPAYALVTYDHYRWWSINLCLPGRAALFT